jgi:hypothetical protein
LRIVLVRLEYISFARIAQATHYHHGTRILCSDQSSHANTRHQKYRFFLNRELLVDFAPSRHANPARMAPSALRAAGITMQTYFPMQPRILP